MSDPTPTPTPTPAPPTPSAPTPPPTPEPPQGNPADLADAGKQALDRMKAERNEAKKRADSLEAELAKINRANESALDKAQREAKEATETATKATADALRFRVAAQHGITQDDADLFLTGTDDATLQKQAARLVERTSTSPRPDLSQGSKGGNVTAGTPGDDFAAFLADRLG